MVSVPVIKIPKPPWVSCYVISNEDHRGGRYMSIIDGGSMIDVIPLRMAEQLVADGVVQRIEEESSPFSVIFGKEGAVSKINMFIRGAGLLDKVFVTPEVRVALISDVTFTDKDITIVKTADHIWGITRAGVVAFTG